MTVKVPVLGICHVISVYERGTFFQPKAYKRGAFSVKMLKGKGLDLGAASPY